MSMEAASFPLCLLRWQEHLGEDFEAVTYSSLRVQRSSPAVRDQVDRGIGLSGLPAIHGAQKHGLDSSVAAFAEDAQAANQHLPRERKEVLRRVLLALSTWQRRLGYNPSFAHLCTAIVALPVSERHAFGLLVALYQRLRLDDYFVKQGDFVRNDVTEVVRDVAGLWPSLARSFQKHGCTPRLHKLIETLLTTLLAGAVCCPKKAMSEFTPLLDRLILSSASLQDYLADHRLGLRNLVTCALGRHHSLFELAGSEDELEEACQKLQNTLRADAAMLELVDSRIDVDGCANFFGSMTSVFGMSVGWMAGQQIGMAAALVHGGVGLGVLGATIGAISTFRLGCASGIRLARQAANELIVQSELYGQQLADECCHQQELQTPEPACASILAGCEGPAAEEEEDQFSLNWLLWGTDDGIEERLRQAVENENPPPDPEPYAPGPAASGGRTRRGRRTGRAQAGLGGAATQAWQAVWQPQPPGPRHYAAAMRPGPR